jgi:hypothetical protein
MYSYQLSVSVSCWCLDPIGKKQYLKDILYSRVDDTLSSFPHLSLEN